MPFWKKPSWGKPLATVSTNIVGARPGIASAEGSPAAGSRAPSSASSVHAASAGSAAAAAVAPVPYTPRQQPAQAVPPQQQAQQQQQQQPAQAQHGSQGSSQDRVGAAGAGQQQQQQQHPAVQAAQGQVAAPAAQGQQQHQQAGPLPHPPPLNEIAIGELQFGQCIGEGGFGKVFYGLYKNEPVAIKLLSGQGRPGGAPARPDAARLAEEFRREVQVLSCVPRHAHVLHLRGACTAAPNLCVVTEYCAKGSLYGMLHSPEQHLSWAEVLYLALGAARGMAHLHRGNVLHRDLKSGNLLVDADLTVKVADFGLSRIASVDLQTLTGGLGTYQWMAPEVLSNALYSQKADVYSFGIVLWECVARKVPYAGMNGLQAAMAVMNRGLRPEIPSYVPPALAELIRHCWAPISGQRPTFAQVEQRLEALYAEAVGAAPGSTPALAPPQQQQQQQQQGQEQPAQQQQQQQQQGGQQLPGQAAAAPPALARVSAGPAPGAAAPAAAAAGAQRRAAHLVPPPPIPGVGGQAVAQPPPQQQQQPRQLIPAPPGAAPHLHQPQLLPPRPHVPPAGSGGGLHAAVPPPPPGAMMVAPQGSSGSGGGSRVASGSASGGPRAV